MGNNNDSLPNINSKGVEQNTFDAIVIGSGMSGGWAAKELCEKGLKTLVLNVADMWSTSKIIQLLCLRPGNCLIVIHYR